MAASAGAPFGGVSSPYTPPPATQPVQAAPVKPAASAGAPFGGVYTQSGTPSSASAGPAFGGVASRPYTPPSGGAATVAPAPVTPDPRDAAYYDQIARLNQAYQGRLAGYNRAFAQDQAAYGANAGQLNAQLPLTLQNTRSIANREGLLESGILAQRQGGNEAQYTQRMGAALGRWQAQQQQLSDQLAGGQGALLSGTDTALQLAIARSNRADLANSPTTPTTLSRGQANKAGSGNASQRAKQTGAQARQLSRGAHSIQGAGAGLRRAAAHKAVKHG